MKGGLPSVYTFVTEKSRGELRSDLLSPRKTSKCRGRAGPFCLCMTASPSQRGVLILPGLGNNQRDYKPLAALLDRRGLTVEIARVSRADWLRNAAGLRDPNYWRGTLNPRPVVDWYLDRVDSSLKSLAESTSGGPIALLAHSAGGWLARVYLLGFGSQGLIDRLITLGSPHLPPPQVAGKYIKGAKLRAKGASFRQRAVGLGYQQVCGEAEVWGDGVVPEPSAHLPGALQISLEDVYHSPVGSRDGTEGKDARLWYGSEPVLEKWFCHLVEDIDYSEGGLVGIADLVDESATAAAGRS